MIKILSSAVDTIECSFYGVLSADTHQSLKEAKKKAADDGYDQEFFVGAERFLIKPHGGRMYTFILNGPKFDLWISNSLSIPFIGARIRSVTLYEMGTEKALSELYKLIQALEAKGRVTATIKRIDLCADFQGWEPKLSDINRFVCRSKLDKIVRSGQRVGTISFGKGNMMARLYNKTEEIKEHKKAWFNGVWSESPLYKTDVPVWRLEFQMRRPKLKEFQIDTPEDALNKLRGVWEFGMGWLEFKARGANKQKCRLPADRKWLHLSESAGFTGAPVERIRAVQKRADEERILRIIKGQLVSFAAMNSIPDLSDALDLVYERLTSDLRVSKLDFKILVEDKMRKTEERYQLYDDLPF